MSWSDWSLRTKLIAACVLVQVVAAAVLVHQSGRLLQSTLLDQARVETQQVVALLGQAIAAPMAQRDYATLQQTLELVRTDTAIDYLVLRNHRGQVVAASGWDIGRPLPGRDEGEIDIERADTTWHTTAPITVEKQNLGELDLGLSTIRMRQAQSQFMRHSAWVGALALAISMAVLAAIAFAITRHLARLAKASQQMAAGDLDVQVPAAANDEIGRLGASFNAMAVALKSRLTALEASEAQQKILLQSARDEQLRMASLLDAMHSGILLVDPANVVLYANAAFARLWSVPETLSGRSLDHVVPSLVRQVDADNATIISAMLDLSARQSEPRELHTLDGRIIVQHMQSVTQGAHSGGSIWFHRDVTLERHTQQRARQALQDPLTGLANRLGLHEALQAAALQASTHGESLALLFIDLDDFKHANDVGGHRTGDEILVTVARTLTGQMRRGEMVARLGGDEFAVLCPRTGTADATAVAARLVETISALRFQAAGHTLRVGSSIGVAMFPGDARRGDDLVACADSAMYEAKRLGKNRYALYHHDPDRLQAESAQVGWNARIQSAIEDRRFALVFQSVHRMSDRSVVHHEALLRMVDENDPHRSIAPAEFLPHAERSGKVRQIDQWVFDACVKALASADAALQISANLSARSLGDAGFLSFLQGLFHQHSVDPRRLHVEIPEAAAIRDPVATGQFIADLNAIGCQVHLDGFGVLSSFAQWKLLAVDAIKIDGAIVRLAQQDATHRRLISAIVDIAHEGHRVVIAEQVADAATLEVLRQLGVDMVQGFHLARPGPLPGHS